MRRMTEVEASVGHAALDADGSYAPVLASLVPADRGWHIELPGDGVEPWIHVSPPGAHSRPQGWKLHVSAGLCSAEAVLRHAVPELVRHGARFKVAASLDELGSFNKGRRGLSQIGKFVTVFPDDDAHAVSLAAALDEATAGLRGPSIPSDRPLRPGSLVHYRYGGFEMRTMTLPTGEVVPAVEGPGGALYPDRRLPFYHRRFWAEDPFEAAGVAAALPPANPLIAGRFLVCTTLSQSARGAVHLAVDVTVPRRCVLKQARRDGLLRPDGRDARDRLRHEALLLERFSDDPRFPKALALVECRGDLFLALDDLVGATLADVISQRVQRSELTAPAEVAEWGRQLSGLLAAVHDRGLVHRDLKPSNVMVGPDGGLQLFDLDGAFDAAGRSEMYLLGTPGYWSPEQERGEPPQPTDDVYSLGAVLYWAATGGDPSHGPRPTDPLQRPVRLVNPQVPARLAEVIERCLASEGRRRYPTAADVGAALADPAVAAATLSPPFGHHAVDLPSELTWARDRSAELARRLASIAGSEPDQRVASTLPSREVYAGRAGLLLALVELAGGLGLPELEPVIAAEARRLAATSMPAGGTSGLYDGEAGVAVTLLQVARFLDDPFLLSEARRHGRQAAGEPYRSADLVNGAAGRIRAHLALWRATADEVELEAAVRAADWVLASAQPLGPQGDHVAWPTPPEFGPNRGNRSYGYAHGAAGIADALLDVHDATQRDCFLDVALRAGRWIVDHAEHTPGDERGRCWPTFDGEDDLALTWCYGAAGVNRFLLRTAGADLLPGAAELAAGAAWAVARRGRWMGPSQCHGLAGSVEALLDTAVATDDPRWGAEAVGLGRLLDAYAATVGPESSWSLLEGVAGMAVALLRLADPERPHLLSPTALGAVSPMSFPPHQAARSSAS